MILTMVILRIIDPDIINTHNNDVDSKDPEKKNIIRTPRQEGQF